MNDWRRKRDDPDAELKEADILLQKADALLLKHRQSRGGKPAAAFDPDALDDLPVLTEVVEATELPPTETAARAVLDDGPGIALVEHLIDLDTEIARQIEAWFANELPQLLSRELDRLSDRLLEEALAHMRATLIPELSNRISNRLDKPPPRKT